MALRRKSNDHIFAIQPPHHLCPVGASYAAWCSRCNAVRVIDVPCSLSDFSAQLRAFAQSHTGCQEVEK